MEKPDTYHLSHVIKVNFIPCYEALRRAQHHFWGSHTKNAEPQSNHVKTVDKPKVRDIPQNNQPGHFKCQGHDRQRKMVELSQVEGDERNKTTKCNANPRLDPGPEKEHQWNNWPNLNV